MAVHPCPVCGLRFERTTELQDHVQSDHAPQLESLEDEEKATVKVPKNRGRGPADGKRPGGGGDPGVMHLPW